MSVVVVPVDLKIGSRRPSREDYDGGDLSFKYEKPYYEGYKSNIKYSANHCLLLIIVFEGFPSPVKTDKGTDWKL